MAIEIVISLMKAAFNLLHFLFINQVVTVFCLQCQCKKRNSINFSTRILALPHIRYCLNKHHFTQNGVVHIKGNKDFGVIDKLVKVIVFHTTLFPNSKTIEDLHIVIQTSFSYT